MTRPDRRKKARNADLDEESEARESASQARKEHIVSFHLAKSSKIAMIVAQVVQCSECNPLGLDGMGINRDYPALPIGFRRVRDGFRPVAFTIASLPPWRA
jgi:hypothetical protein